jgi:hypothetical protein
MEKGSARFSMSKDSRKRWSKWKGERGQRNLLKQLQAEAYLSGHRLTAADKLAAGLRLKLEPKPKSWGCLTDQQRACILARSKAHHDTQISVGIPPSLIYGPWTVLNDDRKWDETITSTNNSRS